MAAAIEINEKREFDFHKLYARGPGCWEWQGRLDPEGYGIFSVKKQWRRAHRISHILLKGPVPDDLFVCHHCDNPTCVRPDHLFVGTDLDNRRDAILKGRQRNGRRELLPDEVRALRTSSESDHHAAQRLRVAIVTIRRARRGATHSLVEDDQP